MTMVLIERYLPDYEDPDAPDVDAEQATQAIVRYLYGSGKYEQWCADYGKDPDEYWQQLFGESYAARKVMQPTPQALRAKRGKLAGLIPFF